MKYFIINTRSITQAEKARRLLEREGIRSIVERAFGKNGCGFSLRIFGNRTEVCALLSQAGISCDIPR